MVTLHSCGVS